MNVNWLIPIVAIVGWIWYQSRRPKWVDDLLLRSYASDHMADGRKDPYAAQVSGDYGVPLVWIYSLKEKGVPNDKLPKYANEVIEQMIKLGPPSSTDKATLDHYRDSVLTKTVGG